MKILIMSLTVFSLIGLGVSTAHVSAAQYMGKDQSGARYFKCASTCGKFKVVRTAKNSFRVFSTHFSGEVKAASFEDAAAYGCQKAPNPLDKVTHPVSSRDPTNC